MQTLEPRELFRVVDVYDRTHIVSCTEYLRGRIMLKCYKPNGERLMRPLREANGRTDQYAYPLHRDNIAFIYFGEPA